MQGKAWIVRELEREAESLYLLQDAHTNLLLVFISV